MKPQGSVLLAWQACAHLEDLDQGQQLHAYINKKMDGFRWWW